MQNKNYRNDETIDFFPSTQSKKLGTREFWKLNGGYAFIGIFLFCSVYPLLFTSIFPPMQNKGKQNQPSKHELKKIKAELQELHPNLTRLKVKSHCGSNRVKAFAQLGRRRVNVRGNINRIAELFTDQFLERLPSAF